MSGMVGKPDISFTILTAIIGWSWRRRTRWRCATGPDGACLYDIAISSANMQPIPN